MVEIVQKGYRNPVTGFPDYRFRGNEFTGQAPWTNEEHDSDMDGVPNYLDHEPLNPNVQYRPYEGYPQEVPAPVPKVRKSRKKSKRKKGKKK